MSNNCNEGTPGRYSPTTISFSSENEKAIPQNPTSSLKLPKAFPDPDPNPASPERPAVTCPVPSCSLVLKGERPHGYLWRHLKRPGIHKRTGDEKVAWVHLHKIEHDKLVDAGNTPAQRKRDARKARAQKMSRAARFELRARSMGVMEDESVVQKVAIWEGMHVAKQNGDSIGVSTPYWVPF